MKLRRRGGSDPLTTHKRVLHAPATASTATAIRGSSPVGAWYLHLSSPDQVIHIPGDNLATAHVSPIDPGAENYGLACELKANWNARPPRTEVRPGNEIEIGVLLSRDQRAAVFARNRAFHGDERLKHAGSWGTDADGQLALTARGWWSPLVYDPDRDLLKFYTFGCAWWLDRRDPDLWPNVPD
jgi:hypothetical protein